VDNNNLEFYPVTFYQRVYCLVRRVPTGRVVSYGAVAAALGEPRRARAVGFALHLLSPDTDVPWQRVINARAGISIRGDDIRARVQQDLLTSEGVWFNAREKTDFSRFGYEFTIQDMEFCERKR